MSVAQVKKRFAEMEAHLGRDVESLKKLKLLKDDVNVLRTSLASAQQSEQRAIESAEAFRRRADDAEAKAQEAVLECERLKSIVASLSSRVAMLERDDDSGDADDKHGDALDVKRMLKALIKSIPKCPGITEYRSCLREPKRYLREDFAVGWSRKSIWELGASVAILSALEGEVTVVSRQHIVSEDSHRMQPTDIVAPIGRLDGREGNIGKQLLQWFGTDPSDARSAEEISLLQASIREHQAFIRQASTPEG